MREDIYAIANELSRDQKTRDIAERIRAAAKARDYERERRLEEAADIFREFIRREDRAWKPMQVFRTNEEVAADEVRHEVWTEVADNARAFLAKLEARDA